MINSILYQLKGGLIVSCQAEADDPFNSPIGVTLFAKAAVMGGAYGIRSEGIEKTKMILSNVSVPVIGLTKSTFEDGSVKITGSMKEVKSLIEIGCHVIAIDGTMRLREGVSGPDFISHVKEKYKTIIMADVSTLEEGIACVEAGADCISTTLSGYTSETRDLNNGKPDFELLKNLVRRIKKPVFAEGRYNTPSDCVQAIKLGAWAVVVGTAITRPRVVTSWFVEAIEKAALDIISDENRDWGGAFD